MQRQVMTTYKISKYEFGFSYFFEEYQVFIRIWLYQRKLKP